MPYAFAGRYQEVFEDPARELLTATNVTVNLPGTTTKATLYADRTKATVSSNPFTTDARGNGTFFADPGEYDLSVNGGVLRVTVPIDPAEAAQDDDLLSYVPLAGDATVAGAKTFSGVLQATTARFKGEPWYDAKAYGAVGNGTADDTAALQAWLNAVPAGGTAFLPDGVYKHNGTLTLPGTDDITVIFGGNAWLAPTTGFGLKVNNFGRTKLVGPKVRLNAGSTATRGLWVFSATRCRIYDPIVWSFIDIPADFVAIDVEDNALWCHIFNPTIRKNSADNVGTFSRGIRFVKIANAGRIFGGDINHCDVGLYVDGSNNVESFGTSFEDCTRGVEFAEPTAGGNSSGGVVSYPRFESVTTGVLISQVSSAANHPWQIIIGMDLATTEISNPNNQPVYTVWGHESIHIVGNDKAIVLRNGAVKFRDSSGNGIVEANGDVRLNADLDNNASGDIRLQMAAADRFRIARATGLATLTNGDLAIGTIGKGLKIAEGGNARMGAGLLVNGTTTIANNTVTTLTRIFVSRITAGGSKRGMLEPGTVIPGVSFAINAVDADGGLVDDDSTVSWLLLEPA